MSRRTFFQPLRLSEKKFSITKYVMSDDIDDIQDPRYHVRRRTFFNLLIMYYVRVGLHGPGWLYVLGMPPRADVPLSKPRACATDLGRGPNLRMGSGRAPCVPRSREHEERPATGIEIKCRRVTKHIYICIHIYKISLRRGT